MKSLKAQHNILANAKEQIEILEHGSNHTDMLMSASSIRTLISTLSN